MEKAPLPAGLLPGIESKIQAIKAELERSSQSMGPPDTYEDLVTLIFDYKICFTDKYKLLTRILQNHDEKDALRFCLDQIKNIHYKIENSFLSVVVNQLENCFSFSEIDIALDHDRKKIKQRIEDYKLKLKKNIDKLMQGEGGENYKILPSVLKYAAEEKMISREVFLQIDRRVNPQRRLGFIVRLANSLIGFYFLLNCKLILDLWEKYFHSLKVSDGVFLRHKLSTLTKEEIFELCAHYTHEKPVVVENLNRYLSWGRAERAVRKNVLTRLGAGENSAPEIRAGKYRLKGRKYGTTMFLRILDDENKDRFHKKVPGVNTYLDFTHIIKREKIDTLITIPEEKTKILYQSIHLDIIDELYGYIEERLQLLTFKNSLIRLSSREIQGEYQKSKAPEAYLGELLQSGRDEQAMRNTLLGKLEHDLKQTPTEETKISERIKLEIQNQKTALSHIDAMLGFIRNLGEKGPHAEAVTAVSPRSAQEVMAYLKMHRIADNIRYVEELNGQIATGQGDGKITELIKKLPEAEQFVMADSIYEGKYDSFEQAKSEVKDGLLLRSVEENLGFLQEILQTGKSEITARTAYVKKHGRYQRGSPGFALYTREMDEQHALLKAIPRFLDFIQHEIGALQEVKKLNNAALERFSTITAKLRELDPVGQAETLHTELQAVRNQEEKLGVAAKFLVSSETEEIIQTSEQIIGNGTVNRYKILLALYNVLDQQDDHEIKLKILDEFCDYLDKNRHEIYLQLKDLLDTQRENLLNQYQIKRAKMSDLWRILETADSPEEKIHRLNDLLQDKEWTTFYPYIENIKQGLLAENVDQVLERNKHVPLEDQYDLLQKIRLFRVEEYDTPEINQRLSRKLLELTARRSVLSDKEKRIFPSQTYSYLMRIPPNREKVIKSINSTLLKEERQAVEHEFTENGLHEHEIKRYLDTHLKAQSDISTFRAVSPEETRSRDSRRQSAAASTPVRPAGKEQRTSAKAAPAPTSSGTSGTVEAKQEPLPEIRIHDLAGARQVFAPVKEAAERALIDDIQKSIYNHKVEEAVNKIQNQIIWESGKSGNIDKMARMLFTLEEMSSIRENEEMSEFLDKQLHTLSSVIINQAQKTLEKDPDKKRELAATIGRSSGTEKAPVQELKSPTEADREERTQGGIRGLVTAMESLNEFTDLHTFADQRGFKEDEEKRLVRIMGELGSKGNFIYLEKEHLLLGQGKLKSMIRRAFDEHTSGKTQTVPPLLLKKAWDYTRSKRDLTTQLRLIGAGSQEERSDIFKELERIISPQNTPVLKLSKQKLFAQKGSEPGSNDAPPDEHADKHEFSREHHESQRRQATTRRRRQAAARPHPKTKRRKIPETRKKDYTLTTQKYIEKSFSPLITGYLKRMYRHKRDFFIPLGGRKQYYNAEVLRRSIEGILRKDIKGRHHADLLDSLKKDDKLFSAILGELFVQYKTKNGNIYYFPKFLKGDIEINSGI
ncbi:MAG: hypothetical protein P8107_06985 [Spirochaetia bacterium]